MESIGERRLVQVLEAGARLAAAPDLPALRLAAVETSAELLGCDLTSYNEVIPGRPALVVSDADGGPDAAEAELLGSLIHQNPLVSHFARTGDGSARRISDFLGDRELRRLELHRRLYAQIGVNYQAAISAASPSGAIVGVALSRADRDFDAREVAALELLRPHLVAAHRRLTEIDWLQRMLAALAEERGAAVLLVDREGVVLRASAEARRLLAVEAGSALPEPALVALRSGLDTSARAPTVVTFEHLGGTVRARIAPGGADEPTVVSFARPGPEARRLAALALGLSPREAEIVALLPGGRSSLQLGAELGVSPRTVEKHLGNAYRKLEVGGRSEALRKVLALADAG